MPTLVELTTRKTQLERYYNPLTGRWKEDEAYWNGTFQFTVPKDTVKIYPATGRNAIDVPANHIITTKPKIKRRRDVHTAAEQIKDDRIEGFLLALVQAMEQNNPTPPLHEVVRFQLLRGMGIVLGPFFNGDKWENGEDGWIWFDSEDPVCVLMPPGPNPSQVFLTYEMTVDEAEQKADEDEDYREFKRNNRPLTEKVKITQWYGFETKKSRFCSKAIWENDSEWIAAPKKTMYRYLPAERIYSGYGLRSRTASIETIAESILNAQVKSLLEGEAQAVTKMDSYMANAIWGRLRAPTQALADQTTVTGPNSISIIPLEVEPWLQEQMPNTILQYVSDVRGMLSEALFSGVVQGQRPAGVNTASGLAILSGSARLKFGPPLRMLEDGLGRTLAKVGLLVNTVGQLIEETEFECRGHKVRTSDWGSDYSVLVELMAEDPEEQRLKVVQGLQILAQKAMSPEKVHADYFGNEDFWADEIKRKTAEVFASKEVDAIIIEGLGMVRQEVMNKQGVPQANVQSGVDALAMMNTQAQQMRAARQAEMPTPAQPGSPEEMAYAVRTQMPRGMRRGAE